MKNVLLMASFSPTDGGCIYIDKQARFFFGEYDFLVLCQFSGVLKIINNICLSRVFTKIKRLGYFGVFFDFIFYWVVWCNTKYIRKIYAGHQISTLICVSEDIISLQVAAQLKKIRPEVKLHFSMLDLPWSYPASTRFNQRLERRFCNIFVKSVDSADFTTEDMRAVFANLGFKGASLITYSAIDVACIDKHRFEDDFRKHGGRSGLVYAGSVRASAELQRFCDAISNSDAGEGTPAMIDMYGPSNFSHSAVRNLGFVVPDDMPEVLCSYQFGLVPMSFASANGELVQTSFPSKAWTYLCCGITPIVVAPENAGISRLLKTHQLGVVLTDPEDLTSALNSLDWELEFKRASIKFELFRRELKHNFEYFREVVSQGEW